MANLKKIAAFNSNHRKNFIEMGSQLLLTQGKIINKLIGLENQVCKDYNENVFIN